MRISYEDHRLGVVIAGAVVGSVLDNFEIRQDGELFGYWINENCVTPAVYRDALATVQAGSDGTSMLAEISNYDKEHSMECDSWARAGNVDEVIICLDTKCAPETLSVREARCLAAQLLRAVKEADDNRE